MDDLTDRYVSNQLKTWHTGGVASLDSERRQWRVRRCTVWRGAERPYHQTGDGGAPVTRHSARLRSQHLSESNA
jgi:hypothetical protein